MLKQLHRDLLQYSTKDERHRGEWKSLPNHVAAFDADGRELTVSWRGFDRSPDAITLRFDLAAPGAAPVPVRQRVRADGRGLRIETAGIPADSRWKYTLSDDPRIVTIGADR
jgi:hypothetical protein